MPHLAGIKFYIFPPPTIHSPAPSHQSNTINITLTDYSLWLPSLVLSLVSFLDIRKPWVMIYNPVKTVLLACPYTWVSIIFFLPQIPPRLIKYYHVVSLCFDSLAALEFLTIFHCDFLSAISSSAQPLIDFSLEKIQFFFQFLYPCCWCTLLGSFWSGLRPLK